MVEVWGMLRVLRFNSELFFESSTPHSTLRNSLGLPQTMRKAVKLKQTASLCQQGNCSHCRLALP